MLLKGPISIYPVRPFTQLDMLQRWRVLRTLYRLRGQYPNDLRAGWSRHLNNIEAYICGWPLTARRTK